MMGETMSILRSSALRTLSRRSIWQTFRWIIAGLFVALAPGAALGNGSYFTAFTAKYPAYSPSTCAVCHNVQGQNSYHDSWYAEYRRLGADGTAATMAKAFANIESLDSDGDGYTNLGEILALTAPQDPSAHPTFTSAPGIPTGVSVAGGNGQATVSFTPGSSGGSTTLSFTVTASPSGIAATGTSSPIIVTGLTNGTSYTFTVTASNGLAGTTAVSATSSSVTPATSATVPTSVVATAGSGQATVSFVEPSTVSPTGYTVTATPTSGTTAPVTTPAGFGSPIVVQGLTNSVTYTFTVAVTNSGLPSAVSNAVTPSASLATAPSSPNCCSFVDAGDRMGILAFDAPSNGGSPITGYTAICTYSVVQGVTLSFSVSGTTPTLVISGLTNGTTYRCGLTATNAVGTSAAPNPQNFTAQFVPSTPYPPSVPTSITATAGNAKATIAFGPPAIDGGSAILDYSASCRTGGTTIGPVTGTASPLIVTGLTNGTAYACWVTARNAQGTFNSLAFRPDTISVTPTAITVPGAPTGVSAAAGNAQATVSFTAPSSNGGSAITGYTVTSNPGFVMATGQGSPITVTGLLNSTTYTFTVIATNSAGSTVSAASSAIVVSANTVVDIRSYIPAAVAGSNYQGYLRVINTGSAATPVSVAVIDGATGVVGSSGQLTASLPAGAAVTFSAQQVETALGQALAASSRPRIRVTASSQIEVQSFMSNPGGIVTQVSDALTASTGYAVRSYVPAANASGGYTSFIRVINIGTAASPIQATLIDDTTGTAGASGQLIASLPAGAAVTFTAQQVEAALGASLNASSRPRISITAVSVPLEVQSFIANPGGAVTQIGGASSGTAVTVRSYIPAANASSGYSGFIRIINTSTAATPITLDLRDGDTGALTVSGKQLVASLPAGAATTFSAQQIETALGVSLAASARPRIQVTANVSVEVQSFMSNPGGTVTQLSGAQSGSSLDVRTYIPAANAAGGYASFIRVINTGTTATPVTVAVVNGTTGVVGTSGQLTASLPAGAAVTFTAQQVETALGVPHAASDRHRIRVTASASTLDVQSFMSNPGGVITETVDFQ
jgi:hypothetical protein